MRWVWASKIAFATRCYISSANMFCAGVHGMVRLTIGEVVVVTSSKEPAWAYPRPSRGRRLHNKRVHPGRSSWWDHQVNPSRHLPFLLPCLPPAISQQPSTTSHQPPTPGHPHTGVLLRMGTYSFFLIILSSLVFPYFESRVESSHDTLS